MQHTAVFGEIVSLFSELASERGHRHNIALKKTPLPPLWSSGQRSPTKPHQHFAILSDLPSFLLLLLAVFSSTPFLAPISATFFSLSLSPFSLSRIFCLNGPKAPPRSHFFLSSVADSASIQVPNPPHALSFLLPIWSFISLSPHFLLFFALSRVHWKWSIGEIRGAVLPFSSFLSFSLLSCENNIRWTFSWLLPHSLWYHLLDGVYGKQLITFKALTASAKKRASSVKGLVEVMPRRLVHQLLAMEKGEIAVLPHIATCGYEQTCACLWRWHPKKNPCFFSPF